VVATDVMAGAAVAITGGTGSFGSVMVERLLGQDVRAVHVLSRDEAKQDALRRRYCDPRLKLFLGDIRDPRSVAEAFAGVDHVFHAAALKQVPSSEFFPHQAVQTNVLGSQNVLEAAAAAGVRSVVCLSSDKAVYPINAMGMTKALMEKLAQAFVRNHPESKTVVSITRYGNVMYSRGSVIPLFVEQLSRGMPLTITEPTMTRFLMSLRGGVELVEYAFLHAEPGDVFVRKAPACTVEVLARALSKLLGYGEPEFKIIGMRHGEKLHETLLSQEEMVRAVDQQQYFRIPLDTRSLAYDLYFDEGKQGAAAVRAYSSDVAELLDVDQTMELLREVPEISELVGSASS